MATTVPPERGKRICLGVISGARGLRGHVWIRSYTAEPAAIAAYGPLFDDSGSRRLAISVVETVRDKVAARIEGVSDRTQAEALKGVRLFVDRERLPEAAEDEFYHADLVGLAVWLTAANSDAATAAGRVVAVHDYGAGSVLEVGGGPFGTLMVPFTRASVPVVDLAGGRIEIAALPGLLNDDGAATPSGAEPVR